jgi:lipopolysaccharide export system permease protein
VLIFRYLAKEVFTTLVALTSILLLIFMSNQFVQYLNRAASGKLPFVFVMKLLMLELPNLMALLLPLGFYMALLLAYGRLYAESEMTVLQACGYGSRQLLKHSFIMAAVVFFLVTILMLWASPLISLERSKILRATGIQTIIQTIVPGRFRAISGGRQIFYVESMNRTHSMAQHVFIARLVEKESGPQWDVLWADRAFAETEPNSFEDYLILQNGKESSGRIRAVQGAIATYKG